MQAIKILNCREIALNSSLSDSRSLGYVPGVLPDICHKVWDKSDLSSDVSDQTPNPDIDKQKPISSNELRTAIIQMCQNKIDYYSEIRNEISTRIKSDIKGLNDSYLNQNFKIPLALNKKQEGLLRYLYQKYDENRPIISLINQFNDIKSKISLYKEILKNANNMPSLNYSYLNHISSCIQKDKENLDDDELRSMIQTKNRIVDDILSKINNLLKNPEEVVNSDCDWLKDFLCKRYLEMLIKHFYTEDYKQKHLIPKDFRDLIEQFIDFNNKNNKSAIEMVPQILSSIEALDDNNHAWLKNSLNKYLILTKGENEWKIFRMIECIEIDHNFYTNDDFSSELQDLINQYLALCKDIATRKILANEQFFANMNFGSDFANGRSSYPSMPFHPMPRSTDSIARSSNEQAPVDISKEPDMRYYWRS